MRNKIQRQKSPSNQTFLPFLRLAQVVLIPQGLFCSDGILLGSLRKEYL